MGTYYRIVCDARREFIDLNEVNGCGDKYNNIGPALISAAALWGSKPFKVINDAQHQDEFYDIDPECGGELGPEDGGSYTNVSKEAAAVAIENGWLKEPKNEEEPVRDENGNVMTFMTKLKGYATSFRCHCGANCFRKPDKNKPLLYECNGCGDRFVGEEEGQ